MSKKGFYIKSIIATGDGMITSKVEFQDGCNLLFGPSEKGKSSVFSIIDYMLGANNKPNDVIESRGYSDYYMEFVTYEDNIQHTAHRNLESNAVIVEDCAFESFGTGACTRNTYPISANRNNDRKTYSTYLMELNGYAKNLKLKKSKTSKANMTFTWARHLFLVGEDRVVSKQPIFIPKNDTNSATTEKSFLYYVTSGQDDSSFQEVEDEKIRRSRYDGMIKLAQESLNSVNDKILELGDVSYADFKEEGFFEAHKEEIKKQVEKLDNLYKQRTESEEALRKQKSQLLFAQEFTKRMSLLKRHYQLDLQRYEHLYEGLSLMEPLTEIHTCPVCHSNIVDRNLVNEEYREALIGEYDKTKAKLYDVDMVIGVKRKEIKDIESKIEAAELKADNIRTAIRDFEPQINDLKNTLLKYQENIEKKTYRQFLQEEAQRLSKQIDALQKEQKVKPERAIYTRQTSIGVEFCNSVKEKLQAWNVIGDVPVVYDEADFDFSIGGQKRIMCGKGSRGVTCTAILMTLIEFCKQMDIPFSQLLVVDSPLTAHFNDERVDADKTTQSKFFKYCNETKFDYQLILIDNKMPPASERESMKGIHFIEFSESIRNGFYLGKDEAQS